MLHCNGWQVAASACHALRGAGVDADHKKAGQKIGMKRRYSLHLLCALAIFAVQSFALVHATQHELSAESTAHCDTCAVAHAASLPPTTLLVPPQVRFDSIPVVWAPIDLTDRRPFARPNSRAPPHFLA